MALERTGVKIPSCHVLVADDHVSIRELIVLCLSKQGHRCITARNGIEALNKFNRNRFDALITDLVMPEMDGIVLTRQLLSLDPELRVMVITGYTTEYPVETAMKAGVHDFLWKPFRIDEFILRFNKMMSTHAMLYQAKQNEPSFSFQKSL